MPSLPTPCPTVFSDSGISPASLPSSRCRCRWQLCVQSQGAGFAVGFPPPMQCEEVSDLYVHGFYLLLWPVYYTSRVPDYWQGLGGSCLDSSIHSTGPVLHSGGAGLWAALSSLLEVPVFLWNPGCLLLPSISVMFLCGRLTPLALTILPLVVTSVKTE